jgi:hypothetical protein
MTNYYILWGLRILPKLSQLICIKVSIDLRSKDQDSGTNALSSGKRFRDILVGSRDRLNSYNLPVFGSGVTGLPILYSPISLPAAFKHHVAERYVFGPCLGV